MRPPLAAAPWRVLIAGFAVVAAPCANDAATTTPTTTTTTSRPATTTTTAPPTTSTLPPLPGCPTVPAANQPDRHRPVSTATADIDVPAGVVTGTVGVRFTPDLPTDVLVFRLWPNSPGYPSHLEAGPVTDTASGASLASDQPDPTTLRVTLARPLQAGDSIEVSLPYRLAVTGSARNRVSHTDDTLRLGSFLPLLAWEPGRGWATDPPTTAFAEATSSPAADYDLAVTVTPGYDVLATGAPGPDGHWRIVGGRDVAVSVGHFATATATVDAGGSEPVAVTVGVERAVGEDPNVYLRTVVAALDDFAARYGPYPWPTFTLAITPGLGGGIEFPSHVMQGPETFGRTTSHEVAHQWFYALVGNNQGRHPWLDEGVASYVEFRHEGTLGASRQTSIPATVKGRAGEPMVFWENRKVAYYRGVYVQAGVAIGDLGPVEQIDCALRHYVAANAYKVAVPADLFRAFEVVFPDTVGQLAPAGLRPE